ncbi:hypothetical protein CAPTEDRAFT_217455 [Capitella teleta]|uniref:SUEL-type lectin domain-containing protein n=1 Tax=Capitella teleta TaxID=283909 RepID=R7UQD7_CAPTE|nr:hypothetical protein CAPTEDRAFT_217455 [Capitella teleta]|eukprot:ELU05611.1 hypothetical protein CAPTEDRAFT_217455 [Capitella teleta]
MDYRLHFIAISFQLLSSGTCETIRHKWGAVSTAEYCDYEHFEPRCNSGQNIHILSAYYGHIEVGKCVKTDLGHLGCQVDVIDIMRRICNGKSTCELAVDDQQLRDTQPCASGLDIYLKVTFVCLSVSNGEYCDYEHFKPLCSPAQNLQILNALYGHIEVGKCVKADLGYLGCQADVTEIIQGICNGKSTCEIAVDDQQLRDTEPCTAGLGIYLKVSFVCLAVSSGEFCDFETFKANCQPGYDLNILQASYGHIALGKCVTVDLGIFGCKTDVVATLKQHCSGHNQCNLSVHDEVLRRTEPCERGITLYLETTFACIRVSSGEFCDFETFKADCQPGYTIDILQAIYGHIARGKCVTVDFGIFGCKTDVVSILKQQCSGHNQCNISVDDEVLRRTKPCERGITVYLVATFACIRDTYIQSSKIMIRNNSF